MSDISKIRFEKIKLPIKTKKQIIQLISSRKTITRGIIDPLRAIIMEAQKAMGVNV